MPGEEREKERDLLLTKEPFTRVHLAGILMEGTALEGGRAPKRQR